VRPEGGRDWWSQIEAAIRHPTLQHLLLVVTRAVLRHTPSTERPEIARAVIHNELRPARRLGKSVIPVRGPGLKDLAKPPRWLGQVMDIDRTEHSEAALRQLAGPSVHVPCRSGRRRRLSTSCRAPR
jgi:hypothetical protein